MALRMARDQRRKGGSYVMYVDPRRRDHLKEHHAWKYVVEQRKAEYESGRSYRRRCLGSFDERQSQCLPGRDGVPTERGQSRPAGRGRRAGPVQDPTTREKEAIEKLHRNLGHPSNKELSRVLSICLEPSHTSYAGRLTSITARTVPRMARQRRCVLR